MNDSDKKRVLIVDDMPTILDMASELIGDRYIYRGVTCGQQALEIVDEFSPDIVLVDIHMPDMDGMECMRQIHDMEGHFDTPILIASNDVSVITKARAFEAGAADFVQKPFIKENLFRKIDMHIKLAEIGWKFKL